VSTACPACGASCADDFRFCPYCATALACAPCVTEERKVVTALFCDLVGFTPLSERHDHEEVAALLEAYSGLARRIVGEFGGAVEKYIGDAVAAVFGFPRAHDDDPLRAVKAGLRLADEVRGLPPLGDEVVRVRIGVNTGEVYARLGVDPSSGGTFVTGDVINTAARLQTAAPPMGVAVGELTHRLTESSIEYEELPPADLKGKAEAVRVWRAVREVGGEQGRGEATRGGEWTPLVGRRDELAGLRRLVRACRAERRSGSAVVVGEPGIGKSRLLAELAAQTAGADGAGRWLQGSCPAYGGAAFSALAEVVGRFAGIRQDDAPEQAERRLDAAVPAGADHQWMLQRLRPLVGLPAPQASREDRFAAWISFLRQVALEEPTTVFFDDLHWADGELLAFVRSLAGTRLDAPLTVIVSGRPELLERAPELLDGAAEVLLVRLTPLSGEETTFLAGELVGEPLSEELAELVRERTGDNPLFVQEYVGLLQELGALRRGIAGVDLRDDVAASAPPDTLQGVIGARLDLLEAPVKAVLSDAAVLGETFWPRGVAVVGGRDGGEVDAAVHELLARQLVRRADDAVLDGEPGLAFWHALTRDVAYARLPKKLRGAKHAAAARWIEEATAGRRDGSAALLAHHYATAYDLAVELGDAEEAGRLRSPAVDALGAAGEHAEPLDGSAAERLYARALAVAAPDDPRRFRLLARHADMLTTRNRAREAVAEFESAIPGLVEAGDLEAAVIASIGLSDALSTLGDMRLRQVAEDAEDLARRLGPSLAAVEALCVQASIAADDDGPARGLELLARATRLAAGVEDDMPPWVLGLRGRFRCALGDAAGLDDIREGVRVAEAQGRRSDQASLIYELAWSLVPYEGPAPALEALRTCIELYRRSHMEGLVNGARSLAARSLYWTGQWDAALAECEALAPEAEAAEDAFALAIVRYVWSLVLLGRGEWTRADPLAADALRVARTNPIRGVSAVYLVAAATARLEVGDPAGCVALLEECEDVLRDKAETLFVYLLPMAVRTAVAAGRPDLARRLAAGVDAVLPFAARVERTLSAQVLELDGELPAAAEAFAQAAGGWRDFAMPFEEAHAWFGAGRCLAAGADVARTDALQRAAALFEELGAVPALGEVDTLLRRPA
jgi:class 3 adenylate cyclase